MDATVQKAREILFKNKVNEDSSDANYDAANVGDLIKVDIRQYIINLHDVLAFIKKNIKSTHRPFHFRHARMGGGIEVVDNETGEDLFETGVDYNQLRTDYSDSTEDGNNTASDGTPAQSDPSAILASTIKSLGGNPEEVLKGLDPETKDLLIKTIQRALASKSEPEDDNNADADNHYDNQDRSGEDKLEPEFKEPSNVDPLEDPEEAQAAQAAAQASVDANGGHLDGGASSPVLGPNRNDKGHFKRPTDFNPQTNTNQPQAKKNIKPKNKTKKFNGHNGTGFTEADMFLEHMLNVLTETDPEPTNEVDGIPREEIDNFLQSKTAALKKLSDASHASNINISKKPFIAEVKRANGDMVTVTIQDTNKRNSQGKALVIDTKQEIDIPRDFSNIKVVKRANERTTWHGVKKGAMNFAKMAFGAPTY
jgi:hypothetical protein